MLLLLAVSSLGAQSIERPMWISSQSPMQSLHLGLMPAVPQWLAPGEFSVERAETWTNVWIDQRPALLIDYEAIDSRVAINGGLPWSSQFRVELEDRIGTGGRLDGLIENFHRVIHNVDQRDTVRRGSVNIEVRDRKTGDLVISRHSLGHFSRAATATLSRRFGNFAGSVSMRVPRNGGEAVDRGGVDTGVSLAWSRMIDGRSVHAGGGVSRLANAYIGPMRVGHVEKTAFVAAVQPVTARTSLIAQYLFNAAIAETGPLANGSHEVSIGTRFHATARTAFDAGIVENIINFNNGPDFGFHFGLTFDPGRPR